MRLVWWRFAPVFTLAVASWAQAPPAKGLAYASFLGAGAQDSIIGVKTDAAGMVYVVGYSDSGDLPVRPGAARDARAGGRDVFVAKFNPALAGAASLLYLSYMGGSGADTPMAMTVDAAGNVYVTGVTTSTDFPLEGWAAQSATGGGEDVFVFKLNPAIPGSAGLRFSTYLGGSGRDVACAIGLDARGAVWVAGMTLSENFPLAGNPVQAGPWGPQDGFVARLNPSSTDEKATLEYSTYLGGEKVEVCRALAVGPDGLVYVAGTTQSAETFPVLGHAFQPAFRGISDIFLTVLDLRRPGDAAVVYSTFLGGSSVDEVRGIAPAPGGGVLLTGYTLSTDFPVTWDALQPKARGTGDVFVTKLDPARSGREGLVYSTYLGGQSTEVAYDIAADEQGNVYLTGYTLSPDFPVTPDALQSRPSGGVDVFCARLNLAVPAAQALAYSTYAGGGGINVAYSIAVSRNGAVYLAGYSQDPRFPVTESAFQAAHGGFADGFILGLAGR
ncbi:MAG: hypothetical protein FJW34_03490 [Acidobacteria bacterium]|nr:hypothetical protein [Acidobacteriota bacterium]